MKRVVAVCVIIALILAASTAALMHLLRVSDEMEASLSAIADAIDRDDMPRARGSPTSSTSSGSATKRS